MNDIVKTSINDLVVESKLKPCGWLDDLTYVFGLTITQHLKK